MLVKLQAQCQQHFKKESNLMSLSSILPSSRTISRTTSVTENFGLYLYYMSQPCMACDNCTPLV